MRYSIGRRNFINARFIIADEPTQSRFIQNILHRSKECIKIANSMKLTVEQLDRKDIDWKAILKAEGAISNDNSQHKEWWDVFHLMMMCEKAGLSELEKWCVLKGRFELKRKCLKCNGDGWIYKNRITSEKTNCLCNPVCEQ